MVTALLKTACGCERRMALPDRRPLVTLNVPLLRQTTFIGYESSPSEPVPVTYRVFERGVVRRRGREVRIACR